MLNRALFRIEVRWKRIAFGVMWILVIGFAALLSLQTKRFYCERSMGKNPTCVFTVSAPLKSRVVFSPGSIGAVEMFERMGNAKSRTYYYVAVLNRRGAETEFARYYDKASATKECDRLRAYLNDPNATTFIREDIPSVVNYLLFVAAVGIGIGICLWGIVPNLFPGRTERTLSSYKHVRPKVDWKKSARTIAVIVSVLLAYCLTMLFLTESDVGWVEITPESRCRFDNTVFLPGGGMRMPLKPGRYFIEVFNPDAPGDWVWKSFDVRYGEVTSFHCRP